MRSFLATSIIKGSPYKLLWQQIEFHIIRLGLKILMKTNIFFILVTFQESYSHINQNEGAM